MKRRIGFVIEQALGHVAYGMGLRQALSTRTDIESVWIDIPQTPDRFSRLPVVGRNWTMRGSVRAYRAIERARRETPFDALFLHTQTISLFSSPHMRRTPTLLSLDATPINYDELATSYGDKVHPSLVERAKLWTHRSVMRNVHAFTAWSQWTKRSLVNDYGADPDKVTVIHPGTVISNFPDPKERGPRKSGPLRVLFVGGDFVRKGGDLLLEVAKTRLKGKVELHLVTAADVPPEEGVFVYRGVKPHSPVLLQRYAEADVFVLPTRGDCLAVVLGEAMASSLPIITTAVGAHAEAVENDRSGFIVGVGDGRALGDRLEHLAGDPELAARMGKRSREIGEERFDMHVNANRIADILVGMAGRSNGAPLDRGQAAK
jgi:glycosyltransferase involved in cell wall biosynthesis